MPFPFILVIKELETNSCGFGVSAKIWDWLSLSLERDQPGWIYNLHLHRGMGKHTGKSCRSQLLRKTRQTGFHSRHSSCYLCDHRYISILWYAKSLSKYLSQRALLRSLSRILLSIQPGKFVWSNLEHKFLQNPRHCSDGAVFNLIIGTWWFSLPWQKWYLVSALRK